MKMFYLIIIVLIWLPILGALSKKEAQAKYDKEHPEEVRKRWEEVMSKWPCVIARKEAKAKRDAAKARKAAKLLKLTTFEETTYEELFS